MKRELIQELWSGYGRLERLYHGDRSTILKLIKFPEGSSHPRGWNTNISHDRKEKSYRVEMTWYQQYNQAISYSYSPKLLDCSDEATTSNEGEKWILLEDLKNKNYKPKSSISEQEIKLCLKWLAHFHSHYLHMKPEGLWEVGTYWHLATRPDELKALDDLELKNAAEKIDQVLSRAQYQTFVHGDAKLANFLFNEDSVAAVDFQYVGGGVGIKDVAYFLSSIFNEDELSENEKPCLDYYFQELNNSQVENEWRELYPWAWCDFYRFLKGWAPGHYKINSYSENMKNQVLSWI